MLDDYLKVRTGQDLIDLGVVPKTSSEYLSLVMHKRLIALRDQILAQISDEALGTWVPAISQKTKQVKPEITDLDEIRQYAKPGMKIRNSTTKLEGKILEARRDGTASIDWGKSKGTEHCYLNSPNLTLLIPEREVVTGYKLRDGVVADKRLGHIVRFNEQHTARVSNGYDTTKLEIPAGTTAVLVEYTPKSEKVTLRIDENIPNKGKKNNFELSLSDVYSKLEVSSLGGRAPLEKEAEVKNQTLIDCFPKTVLDPKSAEAVILGMMIEGNMIFYGPPGSGKSNLAKDIIDIAAQQKVIFTVEGCRVQCNPFSLFDEDFAKIVPPCPECMIKYNKDFKNTGRFKRPRPRDVRVSVADYTEGHGIGFVEGTIALKRMHLAGFKIPKLDGSTTTDRENEYDPEGFQPGALPRTNNGILHLDEMDKLLPQTLDGILEALNSSRMKPDELRYSYPANSIIIGTANDNTVFSDALNDRMLLLAVYYPDNPDVNYEITKKGYHGKTVPVSETPLDDVHKERDIEIRSVPAPVIIEKAVEMMYMKIRDEYKGPGKREVFGSNRSKFDALDTARAKLILDQLFFKSTPSIVNTEYALKGIKYAIYARVQEKSKEEELRDEESFNSWAEKEFPSIVKSEEDTWWCEAYKHVALAKIQIPEIEGNFIQEFADYKEDPTRALQNYAKVKKAYDSPKNENAQLARIAYPFMDYLFKEQPDMAKVNEDQLIGLVKYFVESSKNSVCKIW
ncbi:hypothetical protein FJZ53_05600, partial [Candidatus Woesearchaeota archaeon]|nr:hypothetical protein [Candidatus Woesearchaeota archaeon]